MPIKANALRIHSTLSGRKTPFQTLRPEQVRMYVCGMTVYDHCHVGHGRIFVVFDMVARYLRYLGYAVKYVRNITDVDDKIIARAKQNAEAIEALTARCIGAMHADEKALLCLPPDVEPKATDHITHIVAMTERLVAKGHAYVAQNGDVCFKVGAFKNYGGLAKQALDEMRAGARVAVADGKDDPLDFVLWKLAKAGEPSWPSPWGAGRPGWHIECSAMATECLGEQMDIHGGGLDLRFPHHQNEVAQTESLTGKPVAVYWMHAGHVQVNQEKMSKSLGNFFTLNAVLKVYPGEVIRVFMLASHYRSPMQYSEASLKQAHESLRRMYQALRDAQSLPRGEVILVADQQLFQAAMDDDFNTPEALAVLFDITRRFHKTKTQDPQQAADLAHTLKSLGALLGLLQTLPAEFLQGCGHDAAATDAASIDALMAEREAARASKDWARADAIRDQLSQMGVVLEDGGSGTQWRRA